MKRHLVEFVLVVASISAAPGVGWILFGMTISNEIMITGGIAMLSVVAVGVALMLGGYYCIEYYNKRIMIRKGGN